MQLVEFKNHQKETLRGLMDKAKSKKAVILMHGFERTSVEMKFKNLRDSLLGKINIFRFDFSGCGLSDGSFEDATVEKMTGELEKALEIFKKQAPQINEIFLVGHSIAGCVAVNFVKARPQSFLKIVLLAPALNQTKLLKYYSVRAKMWLQKVYIDWHNYQQYFVEKEFLEDLRIKRRMRKSHWMSNRYFLENQNKDYQEDVKSAPVLSKNILIVHGDTDNKVPWESNDKLPQNIKIIKVSQGDHDLERPDMVEQYLKKVIKFILN